MRADVKAKWVAALRSGDYKQGTGTLLNEKNEYCCLGVLAQVVDPERVGWHVPSMIYGTRLFLNDDLGEGKNADLEQRTAAQYALMGDPMSITMSRILATLNDSWRHDFNAIADYIEGSADL